MEVMFESILYRSHSPLNDKFLHSTKEKAFTAGKIWEKRAQERWEKHHEPQELRPMFTGMYAGEYGSCYVKTTTLE